MFAIVIVTYNIPNEHSIYLCILFILKYFTTTSVLIDDYKNKIGYFVKYL